MNYKSVYKLQLLEIHSSHTTLSGIDFMYIDITAYISGSSFSCKDKHVTEITQSSQNELNISIIQESL